MQPRRAREYRCPHVEANGWVCRKKLVVGEFTGWVEVLCPRCGRKVRLEADAATATPVPTRSVTVSP